MAIAYEQGVISPPGLSSAFSTSGRFYCCLTIVKSRRHLDVVPTQMTDSTCPFEPQCSHDGRTVRPAHAGFCQVEDIPRRIVGEFEVPKSEFHVQQFYRGRVSNRRDLNYG